MSEARWERLFDELDELPTDVRDARLEALARDDPRLARQLRRLLRHADAEVLGRPLGERAPAFVGAALAPGERAPSGFGPYRPLRLLGRGGMGDVHLAERSDGEFEKLVAIKTIRAELATPSVLRRFLAERQILARLEHPAIARLLDGGRTPAGEPFLVLEYVDGEPITRWCRRRSVDLRGRVELIRRVAAAVELAHRQLVVHRDLKPTNVLVDRQGDPKLLDFGIAGLLEAEAGDPADTVLAALPFTPAYAAPEQILGREVTTATDVHGLGSLLYELLAGAPPFVRTDADPARLAAGLASERLELPSARVRRNSGQDDGLPGRIPRDLDAIVARALEVEPARRYPSVTALIADLDRFLEGLPVVARPATAAYRASRFALRHRWGLGAALAVVLALVGGLGAALWQAESARAEARRADRVRAFLLEIFRSADPSRSRGGVITAREVVEGGARLLEDELRDEPADRAVLLDAVAQVELSLGAHEAALRHAAEALELQRVVGSTAGLAATFTTLAEVHAGRGDLTSAASALEQAGALQPELTRPGGRSEERWLAARLHLLAASGRLQEAEELARGWLARVEGREGGDALPTLLLRLQLAGILADQGRPGAARPLVLDTLPHLDRAAEHAPLEVAQARLGAGEVMTLLGDGTRAAALTDDGLALLRERLGPDHPEVALWEVKLGFLLHGQRRLDEAEAVLLHAIAVLEPLRHFDAGSAHRYLGFVEMDRRRWDAASERFRKAEEIFERPVGGNPALAPAARLSLGWALLEAGRLDEAERVLVRNLEEHERAEGPDGYSVRFALRYLGRTRRLAGDPAGALALHRRELEIARRSFGGDDFPGVVTARFHVAENLLALGDPRALEEASREIEGALASLAAIDPESPRRAELLALRAAVEKAGGGRPAGSSAAG